MEATKKLQKLSLAALIVSLLPLATLVPVFLKASNYNLNSTLFLSDSFGNDYLIQKNNVA